MSLSFERSLTRVLRNWSEMQAAPVGTRGQVLMRASEMQNETALKGFTFNEYKGSSHHHRASEMFSLLYAPHMSLISTWINF